MGGGGGQGLLVEMSRAETAESPYGHSQRKRNQSLRLVPVC